LKPLLTLPTACGDPQSFLIRILSGWQNPEAKAEAESKSQDSNEKQDGFVGCESLKFETGLALSSEASGTDTPTGLTAVVTPTLGGLEDVGAISTADIRHATVTLPEGMVVNPGQAAGLQACQENTEQSAIGTEEAAKCPAAAKIGTAKIKSPLIEAAEEKELQGEVFLLQSNPPQIHLLVAASADGVNLKLVGIAHLSTSTGQIEATFGEDPQVEAEDPFLRGHMLLPQLPASLFRLTFEGGAKAALVTPSTCGVHSADAVFTSYADPFISPLSTNAAFEITSGPNGTACPRGPPPFAPVLTAGSTRTEASAFTSFTTLLTRADGQQRIEKFQFTEPAGLAAMIASVPLCPEAQAASGECPGSSQIGHAIVQSGPGSSPLTLPQPGGPEIPIYLTGKYGDSPFGLSIKTPIVAGPFNLGTIVTRAHIYVNPHTAQVTIATDPLPQIVDGVPTDIRSIYAVVDRPGFVFNPSNCANTQSFTGTATAVGGATAALSSPFGVGACKGLEFPPKFAPSTAAKTSKANGASLITKLSYPKAPQGTQTNIAYVKVTVPKQLPSRLTTLQKACVAATFEANPASCPAASVIGHAVVHSPVLPVPLEGPAYFVSHGGEAFPSLTIVLQGDNVTIDLLGTTLIHGGITTTTFASVPDVPFETFQLTLPEGYNSALAANANLCTSKLQMPIEYHAQNGLVLKQTPTIAVSGCSSKLSVSSHKVKGKTLSISVYVPSAGKLTASGKGLSKASKKAKGREVLSIKLSHKGGKLRTKVKLSFAPSKGKKLAGNLDVRFR
jgi:hypothetical protein